MTRPTDPHRPHRPLPAPRWTASPARLGGVLAGVLLALACVLPALAPGIAAAQTAAGAPAAGGDPFGQSQLTDPAIAGGGAGPAALAVPALTVGGFVDVGAIYIHQDGPAGSGQDISWAYGNSQNRFFSRNATATVNEVDLTLDWARDAGSKRISARASVDFYPSSDPEGYAAAGGTAKSLDVDQAFVAVEWPALMRTKVVLGRAPGFVTLEQEETDSPDLRLIGHTYVFTAGGGYPYGLQVLTWPLRGVSLKLGLSNGGLGGYSFMPGDTSTTNRPVRRDADGRSSTDNVNGLTRSGALVWTVFDRAAGAGTLRLGAAGGSNPALTWDDINKEAKPYRFTNAFAAYRWGSLEFRAESAKLSAFYEGTGAAGIRALGRVEAKMRYLLVSWYAGTNHLLTARTEQMTFRSDAYNWNWTTTAKKNGLSYRYRLSDDAAIKLEAVREVQSPQFYLSPGDGWQDLTTGLVATSWVVSF